MENIIVQNTYRGHPHINLITLNRPKVLNALDTEMLKQLVENLESQASQQHGPVAILTGHRRSFSAGADLKQMVELDAITQWRDQRESLWKRFREIPFPIIAAVDGLCLGGGHELAMSCDITIASDNAQFAQPEIGVGIMPGAGGTQRLTRALGKSKAMYYCLTGERFSAQQAYDWGLVAKVVPAQALLQEAFETAKKISQHSSVAIRLIKESLNKSFETSLSEGLHFERRNFYLSFASQDQKEGMRAFLEKRKPDYQGK